MTGDQLPAGRAAEIDAWVAQGRTMPDEALAKFLADRGYTRIAIELERQIARRTGAGPSERPLTLCPICDRFTANFAVHLLECAQP